jgi:histone acetyltransferase
MFLKGIVNFIFSKYGKSGDSELHNMFEAGKLFLYCLNLWKFENPTSFVKRKNLNSENDENLMATYKLNYTRWMCYNYVPSFCDSLGKYDTIMIFGISFLKLVYSIIKLDLQEKFSNEKDKIPLEKRQIVWNHLPK